MLQGCERKLLILANTYFMLSRLIELSLLQVPWNNTENKFKCPCHGSQYNSQGKVIRGPAPLVISLPLSLQFQSFSTSFVYNTISGSWHCYPLIPCKAGNKLSLEDIDWRLVGLATCCQIHLSFMLSILEDFLTTAYLSTIFMQSLALAHTDIKDDGVFFSPWTETDFRTNEKPWWN